MCFVHDTVEAETLSVHTLRGLVSPPTLVGKGLQSTLSKADTIGTAKKSPLYGDVRFIEGRFKENDPFVPKMCPLYGGVRFTECPS